MAAAEAALSHAFCHAPQTAVLGRLFFAPGSSHLEVGNQLVLFWDLSAPWEQESGPGVEAAGKGLLSDYEPGDPRSKRSRPRNLSQVVTQRKLFLWAPKK